MKPSPRVTIVVASFLIVCFVLSVTVLRHLDKARPTATLEEVLYISSPKVLKRLSLGYNGLLADIYWTRAVQYFGEKNHKNGARFDLLAPLLSITTTLDPHLIVAYEFGGNFLAPKPPMGAGRPLEAVELAEYGIRNNPNEWRLYYNLGFIYYTELKDYSGAADAFRRGSEIPNSHPFLKVLAATMAQRGGDIQTARILWSTTYDTAQDKTIKENAVAHLKALQVDEDVSILESLIARYRERTGRLPGTFSDLITTGFLKSIPKDPRGYPYELTTDGRVEVFAPNDLPFIQKGLAPGYVAPVTVKISSHN